jgi:hypothetical protein
MILARNSHPNCLFTAISLYSLSRTTSPTKLFSDFSLAELVLTVPIFPLKERLLALQRQPALLQELCTPSGCMVPERVRELMHSLGRTRDIAAVEEEFQRWAKE